MDLLCENYHQIIITLSYDQNSAYKSFKHSNNIIFNGFPILLLDSVFDISKPFSQCEFENEAKGLLYVDLTKLNYCSNNSIITFECSGWYPIEIVKIILTHIK